MTVDALSKKRPVALLDVDNTLTFGEGVNITYNDNLIETLLASGVKDVYLFSSMRNSERDIKDRISLIEHLKSKGLTVHGVISTSDLVWHQRELASQFYQELNQILEVKKLNNKMQIEQETQALLANPKYAELRHFKHAEAGIAFKEGQITPSSSQQANDMVNMVGVIRTFISDPYASEKGELLKAFLKNKPEWVSSIVVADDGDDNIHAVRAAAQTFPAESVAAIHNYKTVENQTGKSTYTKELTKQDYYELFREIAKSNFHQHLHAYHTERKDLVGEYKYKLFCMGLGFSKTQKLEAVDALSAAISDPDKAKPITKEQLAALRNGELGKTIRSFVKAGGADILLGSEKPITTVRDFVQVLNDRIPQHELGHGL